jgi:UDPglucose 6-dehydrogenase
MGHQLSFFGLGKLGLPLAALFGRSGMKTVGIDVNSKLIARLKAGETPYVEAGLADLLKEAAPALTYTTDAIAAAATDASIILVPTPSDPSAPEFSIEYVLAACNDLAAALKTRPHPRYHLIVISSTVAPGTVAKRIIPALERALGQRAGRDFGVAYVPDFVALGEIVHGFRHPSFLAVGSDHESSAAQAVELYKHIVAPDTPIRVLSTRDAEITKMAFNVFLCMKVSFANYLAQLGDRLGGADLDAIAGTLQLEPKIGAGYLRSGTPYGGPCWPRDATAFLHLAESLGIDAPLVRASESINAAQFDLIEKCVMESEPRSVAVLGLAFKTGTPVTIASPTFELINRLLRRSVQVFAFDLIAQARQHARAIFGDCRLRDRS